MITRELRPKLETEPEWMPETVSGCGSDSETDRDRVRARARDIAGVIVGNRQTELEPGSEPEWQTEPESESESKSETDSDIWRQRESES